MFTPPMFSHIWNIDGSDHRSNDLGSWEVLAFERGELVLEQEDEDVYLMAQDFRKTCKSDGVQTDFSKSGEDTTFNEEDEEDLM